MLAGYALLYDIEQWQEFTIRHKPSDDLISHIYFALKYKGINLLIIKTIFQYIGEAGIRTAILNEPTGQYSRFKNRNLCRNCKSSTTIYRTKCKFILTLSSCLSDGFYSIVPESG
jgi:hypothetical protein